MRIVPYDGRDDLEDIKSLSLLIKAVPFEDSYAPAFVLISPDDDYVITIEEASCLMDGIEIANQRIDELIAYILNGKIVKQLSESYDEEEDEEYDNGESD